MFCIRTKDNAHIQGVNEIVTFNTHNRKGNEVLSVRFNPSHEEIPLEFVIEELETKMIPKENLKEFNERETKILVYQNKQFVFQDVDNSCHFLVFDEDSGLIRPTTFNELTEDDQILLYDPPNDYVITEITDLYVSEETDFEELSNYLIYLKDGGIIIEDLIIV